jgi:E3 ubiquitin-protein ligase RNF115/126
MGQRQMQVDPLMPMVRSLDTIFHGLADTYRQGQNNQTQDRRAPGPGTETDAEEYRTRSESPEFRATGRLFPRDADGPQPMAPPLNTLGEYVPYFPGPALVHADLVVSSNCFAPTLGAMRQVEEYV